MPPTPRTSSPGRLKPSWTQAYLALGHLYFRQARYTDAERSFGRAATHSPESVVVNDGYADAGIWTPYKAGMPVLLPRNLIENDWFDQAKFVLEAMIELKAESRIEGE